MSELRDVGSQMTESSETKMERAFNKFDSEHPKIWGYFTRFALSRITVGYANYSARVIMERVRWETDLGDVHGPDTYKINNNHVRFYARKFMERYPQHDGFFRTREAKMTLQSLS
jgi:hypothetical protein